MSRAANDAREALVREAMPRKPPRFESIKMQRQFIGSIMCFCPDCLRRCPERVALKAARDRTSRVRPQLGGTPKEP
jgi:hypothetical protein